MKQIQLEIKSLPQQRQHLETQLAVNAAALGAMKSKAQHLEMDRKRLELDAGTRRESINRLRRSNTRRARMRNSARLGRDRALRKGDSDDRGPGTRLMDQAEKLKVELAAEERNRPEHATRSPSKWPISKRSRKRSKAPDGNNGRTNVARRSHRGRFARRFERLFATKATPQSWDWNTKFAPAAT